MFYCLLLLLFVFGYPVCHVSAAFPAINISTPIAYATVLVSENYSPPQPPSEFFGLLYVSVGTSTIANMYGLSFTVWHQVQFATAITLNYYDIKDNYTYSLDIATGSAASSNNCPINVVLNIDKKLLNLLNNGDLFVRIFSNNQAGGQLQGNLYRQNDLVVAFIHDYENETVIDADNIYATLGMALIQIYSLKQQGTSPDDYVGFTYYIISAGLPDGGDFQALQTSTGNIAAFLGNNSVGSIPATGIWDTSIAIMRKYVIVDSILYGLGSTDMFLSMILNNSTLFFTPFVRMYRSKQFTQAELEFYVGADGEENAGPLHPHRYNNRQERAYWAFVAVLTIVAVIIVAVVIGAMVFVMKMSRENEKNQQTYGPQSGHRSSRGAINSNNNNNRNRKIV